MVELYAGPPNFVVALAASAGGLKAYLDLLPRLPADFPAAIIVIQHLDPRHRSRMAEILGRCTDLPIKQAEAGDRLVPGMVLVAPPDRHVLVHPDGALSLTEGRRVQFVRPSADVLFKSVAESFGARAIAVVLTGSGGDGADGIRAIKARGGRTIAQDRATSQNFGMPGSAIRTGCIDQVLPLGRIGAALESLVMRGGAG